MNKKIVDNFITVPKALLKKQGIVVLPLDKYEEIKEDLEMYQSKTLAKEILKARKEKKVYSSSQVKKILDID